MRLTRCGMWMVVAVLLMSATASADFLVYHIGGKSGGGGRRRSGGPPGGMGMASGMPGAPAGGPPGMGGMPGAPNPGASGAPDRRIILQGKCAVESAQTVSYEHPTFKEKLYFSTDDVTIYKAKTLKDEYKAMLNKSAKDPDLMMQAAVFALKKGMLKDFYETVDKVLKVNPDHEAAKRVKELRKRIEETLPDKPETEKRLRSVVKRSGMEIKKSKHYILLHDTPQKPEKGHTKNRADERLDLLEKVYESFLQFFFAQDIELNIPEERMMVVLFHSEKDFLDYATSVNPSLKSALGFWSRLNNVAVFYDRGTSEEFEELNEVLKATKKRADEVKKDARRSGPGGGGAGQPGGPGMGGGATQAADYIRLAKTLELLVNVEKENADITTVSHECVHQLAGNTGLLPRHVEIPTWVHEGLATYFEAPGDATWSGIGAVNDLRLTWYKALEDDRVHSNVKFIATNQVFGFARSHGGIVHGYGQAWALTHFLMETRIDKFVAYYRTLGDMPASTPLNPDLLYEIFSSVFGDDQKTLDQDWRAYMRALQTDMQRQAPEIMEDKDLEPSRGPRRR
ncbi:MAG: DUF1570 domain-containing protein [Planctomycetota bacterium]|nr:DUF1570 domain-containing protein [Planctomycetota bacterium]